MGKIIDWIKSKIFEPIEETRRIKPFETYSDGNGGYGTTPKRARVGDAGYDFCAPRDITFRPGEWTEVDLLVSFTDNICTTEDNWVMLIVPKSGLGTKYKMRIANTTGVIDSKYRGHIKATLTVESEVTIKKGEKLVQGVVVPVLYFIGEEEPVGERGTGGFGSTGQ